MSFDHDIEVTPGEVRRAWVSIMAGQNPLSERQAGSLLVAQNMQQYRAPKLDPWLGATGSEIQHRLEHGYAVESKDLTLGLGAEEFDMPRLELDEEEGDLLVDQVLGGEDLYRVRWTEHEAPKSLTIRACIGMHAGTTAEVLAAYMTWILKVVDAAQRSGGAPTVELYFVTQGSFSRVPNETLRVRIPLVKSGEMMDLDSWRAYLTPGAFRTLGFVALGLAADRTDRPRRLAAGMGRPTNEAWRVDLNDGVLTVECPGGSPSFPEEFMDEQLQKATTGA